ncbi:metal-dependent hydrolase [Candidatus Woesearchaeota archaeon]|nr:metal-dependent hydrolase [Candidatus Woesearchaeota archaeon]
MPQAVTHIIIPLVLADIYRDYVSKKKFNIRYVLIAGLAGLLPDIDIAVAWALKLFSNASISGLHRTLTHSLLFPLVFLVLFFIAGNYNSKFMNKQRLKLNSFFLAIAFGTLVHIILDFTFSGSVLIFYPLSDLEIGLDLIPLGYFEGTFFAGLDAIIIVVWLIHEELKHRISDYI